MLWQRRAFSIAAENYQKIPVAYEILQEMRTRVWSYTLLSSTTASQRNALVDNFGHRVLETSKTLSDKTYNQAVEDWSDNLDQQAAKTEDFMIGLGSCDT